MKHKQEILQVTRTNIEGVVIIEPRVYEDSRGTFFESFSRRDMEAILGSRNPFVQDNHSISKKGVLRGLHYQQGKHAQAKIIRVTRGAVQDVIVDIRPESPSFRDHFALVMRAEDRNMIFIPRGCAHGFLALEDQTEFLYKCDNYYNPEAEAGIRFDDPQLNIQWMLPEDELLISEKDRKLPYLSAPSS